MQGLRSKDRRQNHPTALKAQQLTPLQKIRIPWGQITGSLCFPALPCLFWHVLLHLASEAMRIENIRVSDLLREFTFSGFQTDPPDLGPKALYPDSALKTIHKAGHWLFEAAICRTADLRSGRIDVLRSGLPKDFFC